MCRSQGKRAPKKRSHLKPVGPRPYHTPGFVIVIPEKEKKANCNNAEPPINAKTIGESLQGSLQKKF